MTASEPDPDAATAPAPEPSTPRTFALEEMGKDDRRWRLELRPNDLAIYEEGDSQPFVILREQMQKEATLIEGMRALTLSKPKKITFRLSPEAVETLGEWIGKPVLAAFYLKRRYTWVLPVAIIWIIGSLPMAGDAARGVESIPFDPVGLVLGLTLVVAWAFAKWRPHPVLFLVDSIWFMALTGYLIHEMLQGRSKLWMILVGLLLWMVLTGLQHFTRFRGTRIPQPQT